MREPVLVIHGVANRNKPQFLQLVQQFNEKISLDVEFLPVYWGDLAAREAMVRDTLPPLVHPDSDAISKAVRTAVPTMPDLAAALLWQPSQRAAGRRRKEIPDVILQSALQALPLRAEAAAGAGRPVVRAARGVSDRKKRDPRAQALQEALHEELPKTRFLQYVQATETLEQIGKLLGQAMAAEAPPAPSISPVKAPRPADAEAGSPIQRTAIRAPETIRALQEVQEGRDNWIARLKQFARERIHDLDQMMGGLMDAALARVNSALRQNLLPGLTRLLGDIFVYQRNLSRVQERLWGAIRAYEKRTDSTDWGTQARPISVLAHSLGGVISFDAAVNGSPLLWIKQFVTFGSQPAFFHVLDPRTGLTEYRHGAPVVLPPSIGHWTSFWEPMDVLAFLTGTVFLLSDGKTPPRDLEVQVEEASDLASSLLWTHSSYWTLEPVISAIRALLTR